MRRSLLFNSVLVFQFAPDPPENSLKKSFYNYCLVLLLFIVLVRRLIIRVKVVPVLNELMMVTTAV